MEWRKEGRDGRGGRDVLVGDLLQAGSTIQGWMGVGS